MFNGQREWDMDVNDRVWAGEGGGGGEAWQDERWCPYSSCSLNVLPEGVGRGC